MLKDKVPSNRPLLLFILLAGSSPGWSSSILGTAQSYAVLGASAVTNTGLTTMNGNLGVSPGTSITGFPPGMVLAPGNTHNSDASAVQAQADLTKAFNLLAALPVLQNLSGQDLGGLALTPGVYGYNSSAQLNGTLVLNAQGLLNPLFVFQIGSTLTTAAASTISVINGTAGTGIYFVVGSSATLGTTTTFAGNILAKTSISLNTGSKICGRALAQTGAVTLDTNTISNSCSAYNNSTGTSDFGSLGFSNDTQVVPEPGTFALFGFALLALTAASVRRQFKLTASRI